MYSLRSSSFSGHGLSVCVVAHDGYASSAYFFAVMRAMSTFDSPNIFMTRGPTTRPMTSAKIASTIMISRSVIPRWALRVARATWMECKRRMRANMTTVSLVRSRELTEVHDGLQDREHDERDGTAHDHEHERPP